jgi:hypothetical protein
MTLSEFSFYQDGKTPQNLRQPNNLWGACSRIPVSPQQSSQEPTLWRGDLSPLGREAAPKPASAVRQK